MEKVKVGIIVGSDSDLPLIQETTSVLDEFSINYRVTIASAHRTPEKVKRFIKSCEKQGVEVFIAAAGMAAALPGVVASETVFPVIGVPIPSKSLGGVDALYSIVQMPSGIPVATVAIGKAGAKNAGILAVEILAIKNTKLRTKLKWYKHKMAVSVENKDKKLQKLGVDNYIK
jgi:5-(carboxyamino)imidazole ribonucleotide mutase